MRVLFPSFPFNLCVLETKKEDRGGKSRGLVFGHWGPLPQRGYAALSLKIPHVCQTHHMCFVCFLPEEEGDETKIGTSCKNAGCTKVGE